MNFRTVLETIIRFLKRENIHFVVIGAYALHAYGYVRATRDLDFLVREEDQEKIVRFLETLGYETVHRSKGFSNHIHQMAGLGRIDFVYVADKTAGIVFLGKRDLLVLGEFSLPVARAEHLIALKLFAVKNDPDRKFRELSDIQQMMRLPGIDIGEVRGYFKKFGQLEMFYELEGKRKNAEP